jgi:hypothetical protein
VYNSEQDNQVHVYVIYFWNFHVLETLVIFSNLVEFIFSKLVAKIMWTSTFVDEDGTCHINFHLKCPQC